MSNIEKLGKSYKEFSNSIPKIEMHKNSHFRTNEHNIKDIENNKKYRKSIINFTSKNIHGFKKSIDDDILDFIIEDKFNDEEKPELKKFLKFNKEKYTNYDYIDFNEISKNYMNLTNSTMEYLSKKNDANDINQLDGIVSQNFKKNLRNSEESLNKLFGDDEKSRKEAVSHAFRVDLFNDAQMYQEFYGNRSQSLKQPIKHLQEPFTDKNEPKSASLNAHHDMIEKQIAAELFLSTQNSGGFSTPASGTQSNTDQNLEKLATRYENFSSSINTLLQQTLQESVSGEEKRIERDQYQHDIVKILAKDYPILNAKNPEEKHSNIRLSHHNKPNEKIFSAGLLASNDDEIIDIDKRANPEDVKTASNNYGNFVKELADYLKKTHEPEKIHAIGDRIPKQLRNSIAESVTHLNTFFGNDTESKANWADKRLNPLEPPQKELDHLDKMQREDAQIKGIDPHLIKETRKIANAFRMSIQNSSAELPFANSVLYQSDSESSESDADINKLSNKLKRPRSSSSLNNESNQETRKRPRQMHDERRNFNRDRDRDRDRHGL